MSLGSNDLAAKISIVVVTHESGDVIGDLLASVASRCPVVIVDNASSDAPRIAELAAKAGAIFISNKKNVGFGAACNQGAAEMQTDLVFFVNPDTRIKDGTLEEMLAAFNRYIDCVAVSPRIVDLNGRSLFKGRSVLLPRSRWVKEPHQDGIVPILSGAALCVRRAPFEASGGFDSKIFLYHEDDDLSIRLGRRGSSLMYVRNALVVHARGRGSARTVTIAGRKGWWMGRSRIYAARKHGLRFVAPFAIVSAILQLFNPSILWSSLKRAKQIGYLRGLVIEAFEGTRRWLRPRAAS